MFQKESVKVDACKTIMEAFDRYDLCDINEINDMSNSNSHNSATILQINYLLISYRISTISSAKIQSNIRKLLRTLSEPRRFSSSASYLE